MVVVVVVVAAAAAAVAEVSRVRVGGAERVVGVV